MDFAIIVFVLACGVILGGLIIRASLEKKKVQVFVYAIILAIIFCWWAWARADVTDSVTISVTVREPPKWDLVITEDSEEVETGEEILPGFWVVDVEGEVE